MSETTSRPRAILVIGGTRGLGLAIACKLAGPGVTLILNYVADDAAAATAAQAVAARGARVKLVRADAATPEGAAAIIVEAEKISAHLDVIVHCAGIASPGLLVEQDLETIRRTIEVGGMSLLYVVRAALRILARDSSVIYLSGGAVDMATAGGGARAMAKALGECMLRYLVTECAHLAINFNTVRSGAVDTGVFRAAAGSPNALPAIPLTGERLGVDDVANAVALLLSDGARMIRGQTIRVDGGLSIKRS